MQLVIGGAFSGKRKVVRERNKHCSWVTSYEDASLLEWETKWEHGTTLVVEGWEKWIVAELPSSDKNDLIREQFKMILEAMRNEEKRRKDHIVLIMLEIGRGIVPLQKEERRLRDLAGWIAQDAAQLSEKVEIIWNGLTQRIK